MLNYQERTYPLFSACVLNCGLCPRYHTVGISKCPGCAGEGFSEKHPTCGLLTCSQRRGIEYCYLCEEYPCKKYDGADTSDSFITHKNQLRDSDKAKRIGTEAYQDELNEKTQILKTLLAGYDDGRRKNFFCIAVNLLELPDIKKVMVQIESNVEKDAPLKEKSANAVRVFQLMADKQGIELKLRKNQRLNR